jgi:FAD/FMN-containing dehydrogenase
MSPDRDSFFSDIARELGAASIDVSPEARRRYGENTMPGGTREVAGVVFPKSTADVLTIVRAANQHRRQQYRLGFALAGH